jgi:hypothetical protein
VAEKHPHWGAEMAAQAGASLLTVDLIKYHQVDPNDANQHNYFPDLYRVDNLDTFKLLLTRLQTVDDNS